MGVRFELLLGVTCFQPEKLSLVFLVRFARNAFSQFLFIWECLDFTKKVLLDIVLLVDSFFFQHFEYGIQCPGLHDF